MNKTQSGGVIILLLGIILYLFASGTLYIIPGSIMGAVETPAGSATVESSGYSELFIGLSILVFAIGFVIFLGATYFGLNLSIGKSKLEIKAKKR